MNCTKADVAINNLMSRARLGITYYVLDHICAWLATSLDPQIRQIKGPSKNKAMEEKDAKGVKPKKGNAVRKHKEKPPSKKIVKKEKSSAASAPSKKRKRNH